MKWIKYLVVFSCLVLGRPLVSTSWGQARTSAPPTDGTASLEGTVVDAATRKPVVGAKISVKSQAGTMRAQQVITTNGAFQFTLDPKQPYLISFEAEGYEPHSEQQGFSSPKATWLRRQPTYLYRTGTKPASTTQTAQNTVASSSTTPASPPPTVSSAQVASTNQSAAAPRVTPPKTLDAKVVYTPPLVVAPTGKVTQLRAIQFVQSKAELLPDAQPALEQLLEFMNKNPTAEIELAGHTDNQGDFDENVRLSKQRVDLVKEYLVKSGVAANRITTRGYGPTRPIASNNFESTRQLNRRVEMTVLKQ
ncbi:OmpA family protein [Spirosoma soli]|uniref:OmpA family protein n=1 Tax=Spirosoma soli TaxID=1770529 RepID=A0ABW5MBF5_9BACT